MGLKNWQKPREFWRLANKIHDGGASTGPASSGCGCCLYHHSIQSHGQSLALHLCHFLERQSPRSEHLIGPIEMIPLPEEFWETEKWRIVEGSGPGNYQVSTQWKSPSKETWRPEYKYLLGKPPLCSSHFTDGEGSERLFNDSVRSPRSQPHVHSATQDPEIYKTISCFLSFKPHLRWRQKGLMLWGAIICFQALFNT